MKGLSVGVSLLVDDGLIELAVTEVKSPSEVLVRVVHGGVVKARKGVNVPDIMIDCSALPAKVFFFFSVLLHLVIVLCA